MSLCTFQCQNCHLAGNREQSYHKTADSFEDRCPGCGSDDIEVRSKHYDPEYDQN